MERRRNGGRNGRSRGFFRLRRPQAASYSGRQSRNPRQLRRQLQERQLELRALKADLGFPYRSDLFLSMCDPADKTPAPTASAQREAR